MESLIADVRLAIRVLRRSRALAASIIVTLSLAIGAANGNTVQASARATLASGTAILALPLALGGFADAVGIRSAYGVVLVLLIGVFLISQIARRISPTH